MPKKNLTYYSNHIDISDFNQLKEIAEKYNNIKNYFYSRYSGINSYLIIFNHRKEIRDNLIKNINNDLINFNLPARYWKLALDETIGNIKSNWSNTINKVKDNIKENELLTDLEKHYLYSNLKHREKLFNILTNKPNEISEKFNSLTNEQINYLNSFIKRNIRRFKNKKPYTNKKNSFSLDTSMYSLTNNFLQIQSLEKGKRIKIPFNNYFKFTKTIKIILEDNNTISLSQSIDIKKKENNSITERIGIDKNYTNVIATSSGNIYGENLNTLLNEYDNLVHDKYKKRNKIGAILKKHKENGNTIKVNNIINNNLSSKKITKQKNIIKEKIKSKINNSINEFIKNENPKEVALEDLRFRVKSKNKNKRSKHKLNNWCKGIIQERLDYKFNIYNITTIEVNAAYTSQRCPKCKYFLNKRIQGDVFHCPNCDRVVNVHIASAENVVERSFDKRITKYTKVSTIKQLLLEQNRALLELKTGPTPTLETSNEVPQRTDYQNTYKFL